MKEQIIISPYTKHSILSRFAHHLSDSLLQSSVHLDVSPLKIMQTSGQQPSY